MQTLNAVTHAVSRPSFEVPEPDFVNNKPVNHAPTTKALEGLFGCREVNQALCTGADVIAWYATPTEEQPRLLMTWTHSDQAPEGADWAPFYQLRSDCTVEQNVFRASHCLYVLPMLFKGEYVSPLIVPAGGR